MPELFGDFFFTWELFKWLSSFLGHTDKLLELCFKCVTLTEMLPLVMKNIQGCLFLLTSVKIVHLDIWS